MDSYIKNTLLCYDTYTVNKTVLITGTSAGIGKSTTELFARAGWKVIATSRSADTQLFSSWPNVHVYKLDVTDTNSIKAVFKTATKEVGVIDVVVNNAGYALNGVFEGISDEQIRQQFETNVFGLMNVTREAIAIMRPKGSGKIIQVASMGGRLTFPLYSLYHASKWAVEGFSESLHYELQQLGIQIKIIEPGVIKTDFYEHKERFVRPDTALGYGKLSEKVEESIRRGNKRGQPPDKVAQTILKATNSNNTKLRYIVGTPAPALLFLRKILPARIFYTLIRKSFRI